MGKDFGPARYLVYYVYMYVVVYITHMKTFFSTITYTLIVLTTTYHQALLMLRWYFEIRRESN